MCNFGEFIVVEWTAIPVKFYLIHFFKSTQLGTFELIFLNIVWIIHSYDDTFYIFFTALDGPVEDNLHVKKIREKDELNFIFNWKLCRPLKHLHEFRIKLQSFGGTLCTLLNANQMQITCKIFDFVADDLTSSLATWISKSIEIYANNLLHFEF